MAEWYENPVVRWTKGVSRVDLPGWWSCDRLRESFSYIGRELADSINESGKRTVRSLPFPPDLLSDVDAEDVQELARIFGDQDDDIPSSSSASLA